MNSISSQMLLKGFLMAKALEVLPRVLHENGGPFTCSRSYVTRYLRKVIKWMFRSSTTNASKLPSNWVLQGENLA